MVGANEAQKNFQQMQEIEEAKQELEELKDSTEELMGGGQQKDNEGGEGNSLGQKRPRDESHNQEMLEMDPRKLKRQKQTKI